MTQRKKANGPTSRDYALTIRAALYRDWGHLDSIVNEICAQTGAGSGTVKHWLAATNGPSGEHLLKLMAVSDEVWDSVIQLAERTTDGVEPRERVRRAIDALRGKARVAS